MRRDAARRAADRGAAAEGAAALGRGLRATAVRDELRSAGLVAEDGGSRRDLRHAAPACGADPRRRRARGRATRKRGHRALDQARRRRPSPASRKKHGVAVEALQRAADAERRGLRRARQGRAARRWTRCSPAWSRTRCKKLPIPKVMRWGDGDAQFVRPVHGLVMLHGERVVPGKVLGLAVRQRARAATASWARARSRSASADDYEAQLRDEGMVIADFAARKRRDRARSCRRAAQARRTRRSASYAGPARRSHRAGRAPERLRRHASTRRSSTCRRNA